MLTLSNSEWNVLLRQSRCCLVTGYLYHLVLKYELLGCVPKKIFQHFESANVISEKQRSAVRWELQHIKRAFSENNLDVILLKGAAYIICDLPNAAGRLLSDIDLLVPAELISDAEFQLSLFGWFSDAEEAYDELYYRKWMHEIPPLIHVKRLSTLDVHHTILPPTAKYKPNVTKLFDSISQALPGVYTLNPVDMIIHSATHLFHEGEFNHGLRDILDLHELLTYFDEHEPEFWTGLVLRSIELDLINPLYYALHYCSLLIHTKIPKKVFQQAKVGQPNACLRRVMDWLFIRGLRPSHPSCDLSFTGLARWLLYVRSHYLRMPMYLLIPHLIRKALRHRFTKKTKTD